jgi:hypothetical protein
VWIARRRVPDKTQVVGDPYEPAGKEEGAASLPFLKPAEICACPPVDGLLEPGCHDHAHVVQDEASESRVRRVQVLHCVPRHLRRPCIFMEAQIIQADSIDDLRPLRSLDGPADHVLQTGTNHCSRSCSLWGFRRRWGTGTRS